jgi:hypothetical protein
MSLPLWRVLHRHRRTSRSRGQSLVELALIMPVFLILIATAIDLGRLFSAYIAIVNATKEGALYGATNPLCDTHLACADPLNVVWRVRNETGNLRGADGAQLTPTIACVTTNNTKLASLRDCRDGDTYQVSVSYDFRLITPILGSLLERRLTLHASADATILNQAFDPIPGLSVTKTVRNPTTNGFERTPIVDPKTGLPTNLELIVGKPVEYQIVVRNTGPTVLTGVTMTDDAFAAGWPPTTSKCPSRPSTMAVAGTYTCTYQVTPSQAQTDLVNTVIVAAAGLSEVQDVARIDVVASPPELVVSKGVRAYRSDLKSGFGPEMTVGLSTALRPTVWYRLRVENTGGSPATTFSVSDSFGPLPDSSDCSRPPSSLGPGKTWSCFYPRTFDRAGTVRNTATFHSRESGDIRDDATVIVVTCAGGEIVVPNLVEDPTGQGRRVREARDTWAAAGFTGPFSPSGSDSDDVTSQDPLPFACRPPSTSVSVGHR